MNTENKPLRHAEPWKPKEGETYYFLVSTGAVEKECFQPSWPCDNARLEIGNSFRTKAEAEAAAERVKAALKGEVGDKVMSREKTDSAMRCAIGICAVIDKNDSLLRENNKLKEELESFIGRCEYLQKAKEELISKQPEIDAGKVEIEGYERSEWVKLNPDDKSTFPTAGQRVLIWCEGEVCIAYAYIDDVPGQDPCCVFATPKLSWHGEVTHWRPLPQPPKAKEK